MRLYRVLIVFFFAAFSRANAQQLLINEVSQGPSGSKEYVEFIVAGNPTCQTPVPCMDLRGVVIDDNNGYFATGSGTGIAGGALRFSNDSFWSCIPQGTLIVVYNNSDINAALPPNDASMTDNNCRLVLPANSTLLEGQSVGPTSSDNTYPAASNWVAGGGSWSQVGMANANDSFQIRSSINAAAPSHSVSWGNNTTNTQLYFSTATGSVFSMTNASDNNSFNQANWSNGTAGTDETPGASNSPENDSWIAGMNPQCGIATSLQVTLTVTDMSCPNANNGGITTGVTGGTAPYTYVWSNAATTSSLSGLSAGTYTVTVTDAGGCTTTGQATIQSSGGFTVTLTPTNESCANTCDGSISSAVNGGVAPYSYTWFDGSTGSSVQNLCPGNYLVNVSDNSGCTTSANATILAGTGPQDATINAAGPFTTSDPTIQLTTVSSGGTWSSDCGTCLSSNGQFSPTIAGAGTFQICYTTGSGNCAATSCINIVVTVGCTTDEQTIPASICAGNSYTYNGQTISTSGTFDFTFTNQQGCDSIIHLALTVHTPIPQNAIITMCEGDSVQVSGQWVYQSDVFDENTTDLYGCPVTNTTTVIAQNCDLDDFTLFVPNTFTPNGDNTNDTFSIVISGAFLEDGFIINRWGNVIKTFSNTDLSWDGRTADGTLVQDGVYTWVIYYTPTNGNRERSNGFVTVLH
jgi:gliding motility-associated-like protein